MGERKRTGDRRADEIIEAFDRERSAAGDLRRRCADEVRKLHERDRQVLIERRRRPR